MSTHKSQQMLQIAEPNYTPLKANEWGGRVRTLWWEFNAVDDGGVTLAQNDLVTLGILPAGARILHGRIYFGDYGTGLTLDIGLRAVDGSGYLNVAGDDADDVDAIADGVDIATAASASDIANTAALHMGYVTEKELYVEAKFLGANPDDTSLNLNGYLLYVLD